MRALGVKLAVISVSSFACKAVLVALDFFGVMPDGSSLYLTLSTLLVEALPSMLTIILLIRYHSGSLAAARGSDIGVSLLHRASACDRSSARNDATQESRVDHDVAAASKRANLEQDSETWLAQFMANGRVIRTAATQASTESIASNKTAQPAV